MAQTVTTNQRVADFNNARAQSRLQERGGISEGIQKTDTRMKEMPNLGLNTTALLSSARNQDRQSLAQGGMPGMNMAQNLFGGAGGMSPGAIMNFGRNAARKTLAARNAAGGAGMIEGAANVGIAMAKKWAVRQLVIFILAPLVSLLPIIFLVFIIALSFMSAYNSLLELISIW